MSKKLCERIRGLRTQMDLNQPELAKRLNVSKQAVSNWENGNRSPDSDTLIRIADFFDVSLDYLLGRTDYPKSKIYEGEIEGRNVRIDYDKEVYPDGLTHEQVIQILKTLKAAGFSFSDNDENK